MTVGIAASHRSMNSSIQACLQEHGKSLQAALGIDISTARIEIQCLLQATLQVARAYLYAHPEQTLSNEQQATYLALLARRKQGEPIAYLVGRREFYGLDFKVTTATLIPRADTELLVEQALQRIPMQQNCDVLDMGTGSGAIALSIAHARPQARVVAIDASPDALQVASDNQHSLGVANVSLLLSNWFEALSGRRFDVIVSNPPYIAAGDVHLSQGDVKFEPPNALTSGADGLLDIRYICSRSMQFLKPGAWLMLEHGYNQASVVREILQQAGLKRVYSVRDIAGIERVSGGSA